MLCGSRKDDSIGSLNVDAGVDIPRELGLDGLDDIYGMDMNHTVYISGPHHVLSNCQNDLPGLLQWWGWTMDRLSHICKVISRKYYKARMLETCFSSANTCAYAADIERFKAGPNSHRWGTVAAAVCQLVAIFPGLVFGWNKAAFLGRGHLEQRDSEHSCARDLTIMVS